jgi:hypothetical protein
MAQEWWEMLRNTVQKAQDLKEINSNVDTRRISFDLNAILIAAYWTYLVEKDHEVFREARFAIQAKMKRLTAVQLPAGALKTESDWKQYLKERHENKGTPVGILQRPGNKVQSSMFSPSIPPTSQKKSKSIFFSLTKLTKS